MKVASGIKQNMYTRFGKRVFDFCCSTAALIILFPAILIVACFLWIAQNQNPFYFQERIGKDFRLFKIIKFRTMTSEKNEAGNLLPDVERITRTGNWLRKNSIDEIPQLWNVFKGEMSLVGPRPLLLEDLKMCNEDEKQRYKVLPGITGWAQVNGRNFISWKKRLQHDIWYLDKISFILDLKIILKTFERVWSAGGTFNPAMATTEIYNSKKIE